MSHLSHCGRRKQSVPSAWWQLSDTSHWALAWFPFCSIFKKESLVLGWLCGAVRSILHSQPPLEGRASVRSNGCSSCCFPWFQAWVSLSLWLVYWCLLINFASCRCCHGCSCTPALCCAAAAWQVTSFLLSPHLKVLCVLNWNHSWQSWDLRKKVLFWML